MQGVCSSLLGIVAIMGGIMLSPNFFACQKSYATIESFQSQGSLLGVTQEEIVFGDGPYDDNTHPLYIETQALVDNGSIALTGDNFYKSTDNNKAFFQGIHVLHLFSLEYW